MAAGRGDRDRALGHLLAAHVGKIDVVSGVLSKPFVESRRRRFDFDFAGKERDGLGQAGDGDDFDLLDHGRFGRAGRWHDDASKFLLLRGGHRHRERAFGRARGAVERQFADDRVLFEEIARQLPAAGQHAQRDRQIERRGLLRQARPGPD